ncbi:MAG: general secretion pathway protein GspE [Myxococcaceae bacterium]|nr:general secretion pathway protein GspE [Myxococcaceae bacterium]
MRKKIGELLVESGAVTEAQVRTALAQKRAFGRGYKLGSVMVSMGMVTPKQLARALAIQFDVPFVQLPEVPPEVAGLLSLDFQSEHRIVPFRLEVEGKNERLHVAVEDPADLSLIDELRFQLHKTLRVYVAASDDIDNALVMARGEKLDIIHALPMEDGGDGEEMRLERGNPPVVEGSWDGEEITPPTPIARPEPAAAVMPPPPPREATDFIDDLLGTKPRPAVQPPPPPPPDPDTPRVPVVMFGGAASNVKPPERHLPPDFSEEDLQVLDNLERISHGEEPTSPTQKIMPAQMIAALIRLLIQKRIIQEEEFLEELTRK